MAARTPIAYRTARLIEALGPTDVAGSNPLDNTNDGATATFKVYDPAKSEVLSADEASGQTILSVTNETAFQDGDLVEVDLDDGTIHESSVSSVDSVGGTITIAAGLASAAAAGKRVRVVLGTQITMTEFGSPVLGRLDFGFRGTLPGNHPGLYLELKIDVEITFNGGAGLEVLRTLCFVVKSDQDCADE